MNRKTNAILAISTLTVFFLGALVNDPFHWFQKSYSKARALLSLDESEIRELVIYPGTGRNFSLVKDENENWMAKISDISYLADDAKVSGAIQELLNIKRFDKAGSGDKSIEKHNLRETDSRVDITSHNGKTQTVIIGDLSNTPGETMVRLKSEKNIYIARSNLHRTFHQSVDSFRDRHLIRASKENISALRFEKRLNLFLENKDSKWMSSGTEVNGSEVAKVIDSLLSLEVENFSDAATLPLAEKITLYLKAGEPNEIEIRGPDKENRYYARSASLPFWGTLMAYKVDSIQPSEERLKNVEQNQTP